MRQSHTLKYCSLFAATILIASVTFTSNAQTVQTTILMEEPARWTQEDVTEQQKYSTATKESIAAQQESIQNCQILDPTLRPACIALARKTYSEEMAAIRARFKR
jgi:hypothetical protein